MKKNKGTRVLTLKSASDLLKPKHSQVGLTLSWFAAFIVIVFIMVIFLVFTSFLAAHKVVPDLAMDKIVSIESVEKTTGMGNLESEQKFLYLLNYPVGKGNFRDLVLRSNKNSDLKDEVNENASYILESSILSDRCFIFNFDNNYLRNKNFEVNNRIYPQLLVRIPENKNGNIVGLYSGKC
ncbi:MAG: hypothetical protein AABW63_02645 [Nanoarchaeota archaeon]